MLPSDSPIKSNITCFAAMVMWSFAFPIADLLLQTWGTIALVFWRMLLGVVVLMLFWILQDGWRRVLASDWGLGLWIGGIGFGLGSVWFLLGQAMSDAVTPAIAAAMMPIFGALLETLFDGRRMTLRLFLGIAFALSGGLMATGARFGEGHYGWGSLLCMFSVVLFAWATRATTRGFPNLSFVGQTSVTLGGALMVITVIYIGMLLSGMPATQVGLTQPLHLGLLLFSAVGSAALAQFLWIRGAARLGILLASFHMNAVPFYVMVVMVLWFGASWNWWQAFGAAVVAVGVWIAQSSVRKKH